MSFWCSKHNFSIFGVIFVSYMAHVRERLFELKLIYLLIYNLYLEYAHIMEMDMVVIVLYTYQIEILIHYIRIGYMT